jgi:hypothetical protein
MLRKLDTIKLMVVVVMMMMVAMGTMSGEDFEHNWSRS